MTPDGQFCGSCGTTIAREPASTSSKVSEDRPVLVLHPLALLVVIAVHAFVLWIGKKAYSLMEWRFYKDRLEYTIGIFGGIRETIPYARVADVSLTRGVIQKRRGLGTIVITSTGGQRDAVTVSDIEDSENVYEQVRALALARQV